MRCTICDAPTGKRKTCFKDECVRANNESVKRMKWNQFKLSRAAKKNIHTCFFCNQRFYYPHGSTTKYKTCGDDICIKKKEKLVRDLRTIYDICKASSGYVKTCEQCGDKFYYKIHRKHCGKESCMSIYEMQIYENYLPKASDVHANVDVGDYIQPEKPKLYPCKKCGKLSPNRFFCPDHHSAKSKSIGIGGNVTTSHYFTVEDLISMVTKSPSDYYPER